MTNVIYEAKPSYGINPAFIIFCIVVVSMVSLTIAFWRNLDITGRYFLSGINLFLLFCISCSIYTEIDSKRNIYDKYIKDQYYTVEGYITEYYTNYDDLGTTRYDSFYVSDKNFHTPGFVSRWGYPLSKSTGSPLQNGIKVKIHYIPYKYENVIMYLELLE